MIEFLIIYILILFLSALAINGFFNITRGRWEVQPDGTKVWEGKILSGWSNRILPLQDGEKSGRLKIPKTSFNLQSYS